MREPKIQIGCVANLWSRQMHFEKAGDIERGHTHNFDHLTLLAHGSVECAANGAVTMFKAPHMIYIRADVVHEFTALEDNTVAYCIHALRSGDGVGDIIDPASIPNGVDLLAAGVAKGLCPP